jgi:hypothetical protein
MTTKKIILNELRALVKQTIKEENQHDKLYLPIGLERGAYSDIRDNYINSIIEFMKQNNSKLIGRIENGGVTYLEFDKDYRKVPGINDFWEKNTKTWEIEANKRWEELKLARK